MNKPSDRDHSSVIRFLENEGPLMEKDRNFIYHKEDLVTLRSGREHAWLDTAVENMLRWLRCRPIEVSILRINFLGTIANMGCLYSVCSSLK